MARVKSVKHIGKQPVYNMTVEKHHNFLIDGNVIVKNCDSLRYFCVYWTVGADDPRFKKPKKWTDDMWEDYNNAPDDETREYLIKKYGEPA